MLTALRAGLRDRITRSSRAASSDHVVRTPVFICREMQSRGRGQDAKGRLRDSIIVIRDTYIHEFAGRAGFLSLSSQSKHFDCFSRFRIFVREMRQNCASAISIVKNFLLYILLF